MVIGAKGPSDALARSLEALFDPPNTNGVAIFTKKSESRECSRSTLHT